MSISSTLDIANHQQNDNNQLNLSKMNEIKAKKQQSLKNGNLNHLKSLNSNGGLNGYYKTINGSSKQQQLNVEKTSPSSKSSCIENEKKTMRKQAAPLEEQFKAACDAVNSMPKNGPFQPSNEMLLKFYGYFKQASVGPTQTSRPSMFKVVERAKWDAWNSLRELSKEQAMKGYIDEIKTIIEVMPQNEQVQKLIDAIGPVYEFVDENNQTISNDVESNDDENSDADAENDTNNNSTTTNYSNDKSMTTSSTYDKIDDNKKLLNGSLNGSINGTVLTDSTYLVSNGKTNGHANGAARHLTNGSASNGKDSSEQDDEDDDDEEDYCDTSDNINENDLLTSSLENQINLIKPKPIKHYSNDSKNHDFNHNNINGSLNKSDQQNGDFNANRTTAIASSTANTLAWNRSSDSVTKADLELEMIINQYGGESMNLPSMSGQFYSNQPPRQSRPSSSQSQSYRHLPSSGNPGSSGGGGGAAGGSSGGGDGGSGYVDSNRQIIMILLRLQQDTNNVLNRLSYLENTVASIQNNLQLNRIDSAYQTSSSAFSSLINNQQRSSTSNQNFHNTNNNNLTDTNNSNSRRLSFWKNLFRNVDWTTVTIAIIWPFVIRLVFMLFRKVRLVIKLKKRVKP